MLAISPGLARRGDPELEGIKPPIAFPSTK
jgi:hypothetical protein